MAQQTKAGVFALNTTTGNQAITGVGFTPRLVIFFPAGQNTVAGIVSNQRSGFGVGISSADRRCIGSNSQSGVAGGSAVRHHNNTKCIEQYANNSTTTVLYAADFVSQNADGFTINVTTAPASAYEIGYVAIGGADITNAKSGQFQSNTVTGDQAITGVGFKPDAVFLFSVNRATAPPDVATTGSFGFGMGSGSSSQGAASYTQTASANPTATIKYQRTTNTGNFSANADEYSLVSLDSDGFTINVVTAPGAGLYIHYLCIKGGQITVGAFNTQAATGNFSVTGLAFQPTGMLFLSKVSAASTSTDTGADISMGAASGSASRFSTGGFDQNGVATSNSRHFLSTTRIYAAYNTSATLIQDVDVVSFDAGGFTLNQITTDGTARQVLYMALGSAAVAATTGQRLSLLGVG